MKKAVIVGSGLAGLTAGYRLQQAGWQIKVLEASERVGGRIRSVSQEGFLLDVGPLLITDKYTEYLKLVNELGLSHLIVDSSPLIAIAEGRDLHVVDSSKPLRSFLRTKLLTTGEKLNLVVRGLRLVKPLRTFNPYDLSDHMHYDTESISAYLNRVFGPKLNTALFATVARGMTLSTGDNASVIEFFGGALIASGKMKNLRGGLVVLPQALAQKLDVALNAPVTSVYKTDEGVAVAYSDESGTEIVEHADACVITTRFADAVEIYPPLKETGSDLLDATEYVPCFSMQLMYGQRPHDAPFIIMIPEATSPEIAAIWVDHVKSPDRAPSGSSLFTVIFDLVGSDLAMEKWSDERLTDTARELVESLFPEVDGHFVGSHLTRWGYAAHDGRVGYYKALDAFITNYPRHDTIQLAGDYMSISGKESAVVAANKAVERLLNI
jgi:oxygen-dependent protoporphyrinogen oxidase